MAQVTRAAHDKIAAYVFFAQVARKTRKSIQTGYLNPIRYPPPSDMRGFVSVNGDLYVIFPLRDPISGQLVAGETISDAALAVVQYTNAGGGGVIAIPSSLYSSAGLGAGYYSIHILNSDVPALTGTKGQLTLDVQTTNARNSDINVWVGSVDTNVVTIKGGSNPIDANVVEVQGSGSAATNLRAAPLMGGASMTPFTSISITTGTETGSVANIAAADGSYDIITEVANATDFYYEVTLTSSPATHVNWTGFLITTLVTDTANVYAWNWGASAWDQIGIVRSNANPDITNQNYAWPLDTAHTGTGGNLGKVRVRFTTAIVGTHSIRTDRMLCADVAAVSTAGLALTTDVTTATSTLAADISASTAATAGNITSAVTAIDAHTDSAVSTLATAAALATDVTTITGAITSAVTAIDAHTDSAVAPLATSSALSTDTAAILAAISSGGGTVDANVITWLGTAPNSLIAGRVDVTLGDSQSNAISAATFTQAARQGLFGVVWEGTIASSADANHVVLNTGLGVSSVNDVYKDGILAILSATGTPAFAVIDGYVGSTKTCTLAGAGLVIGPTGAPQAYILRFGLNQDGAQTSDVTAAITAINSHTDGAVSPLAATLALILGLHRHNAMLDGGSGHADAQYNSASLMVAARLRVFATATALGSATPGHPDGTDSEIQRYELVGVDDGTGRLGTFTLTQVFP
jgi:hypothetical protein